MEKKLTTKEILEKLYSKEFGSKELEKAIIAYFLHLDIDEITPGNEKKLDEVINLYNNINFDPTFIDPDLSYYASTELDDDGDYDDWD